MKKIIKLKEIMIDDIDKEIISFLNTNGGIIYTGIKDNGEIIGAKNELKDQYDLQISNIISEEISGNGRLFITHYYDDNNVLVIEIQKGNSKPYYLKSKGPKPIGVFIRAARSKRQATEGEILQMIRDYYNISYEDEISQNQDLHFNDAKKYYDYKNINFIEEKMFTIGLKNNKNQYTNLGLLISDENPMVVKMAAYDKDLNFKYKKEFKGSLLIIVDTILNEIEMFNITSAIIPENGWIREETTSFPGKSLREAVLNAICHADYSIPSNIKIEFFEDRCQITNPGGIYRYNLEDIMLGIQSYRNPKLLAILYRLGYIENYGMGMMRIREAYKGFNYNDLFINSIQWFRVILPNMNYIKEHKLEPNNQHSEPNNQHSEPNNQHSEPNNQHSEPNNSKLEENYLEILKQNIITYLSKMPMTNKELLEHINASKSSIFRATKQLKEIGKIEYIGSNRKGYWKIK